MWREGKIEKVFTMAQGERAEMQQNSEMLGHKAEKGRPNCGEPLRLVKLLKSCNTSSGRKKVLFGGIYLYGYSIISNSNELV